MSESAHRFEALGQEVTGAVRRLETFPAAASLATVRMTSDEVTAMCPVTGQPDFYTVDIDYQPTGRCIESKSLKLYLQSFRSDGIFCEDFAQRILDDVCSAIEPAACSVVVTQKPRGGITIRATATHPTPAAGSRR